MTREQTHVQGDLRIRLEGALEALEHAMEQAPELLRASPLQIDAFAARWSEVEQALEKVRQHEALDELAHRFGTRIAELDRRATEELDQRSIKRPSTFPARLRALASARAETNLARTDAVLLAGSSWRDLIVPALGVPIAAALSVQLFPDVWIGAFLLLLLPLSQLALFVQERARWEVTANEVVVKRPRPARLSISEITSVKLVRSGVTLETASQRVTLRHRSPVALAVCLTLVRRDLVRRDLPGTLQLLFEGELIALVRHEGILAATREEVQRMSESLGFPCRPRDVGPIALVLAQFDARSLAKELGLRWWPANVTFIFGEHRISFAERAGAAEASSSDPLADERELANHFNATVPAES